MNAPLRPLLVRVLLESPFAGDRERNIMYARACVVDCFSRGEAAFASHLIYAQARGPAGRAPVSGWVGLMLVDMTRELCADLCALVVLLGCVGVLTLLIGRASGAVPEDYDTDEE